MTAVGPPPWATRIFTGRMVGLSSRNEEPILQASSDRPAVAVDVVRDERVVALGSLEPFGVPERGADVRQAARPVVAHGDGAELVVLREAVPLLVLVDQLD